MQFLRDKDGNEFRLEDETWDHIREFHPEIADLGMLEAALKNPDWIVRSNWDAQSYIYYMRIRPRRYRAIVVDMFDRRIKTTMTTDKVKEGEVIWPTTKFMR